MKYTLRNATDTDRSWLEQLRRVVYRELFDTTWGGWDEQRHQRHFMASWSEGHISIIETEKGDVGMVQVIKRADLITINEIQINPQFQRQGYGSQVLRGITGSAETKGLDVVLSLGLKNEGAFRLYKRLGFRETERSDTHIHMKLTN
ncbi:MAG: GNAT family N-acetyltransferase [Rhodothermales bacterium]